MTNAEKLNAILIVSLFIVFSAGYVIGTLHSSPTSSSLPANYNPALADANAALRGAEENVKTCYQIVREQARGCPQQPGAVSH